MSKRQTRRETEPSVDAMIFAEMDDDDQGDAFIHAMERRSARRKTRARRAAQHSFDSTSEKRWLRNQVADWDDYGD